MGTAELDSDDRPREKAAAIPTGGASCRDGADAIVMVEETSASATEGAVEVHARGQHRAKRSCEPDEDVAAGSDAAGGGAGRTVRPRAPGPASRLAGESPRLVCSARPRVAIVSTGDELVTPRHGRRSYPGRIRDSTASRDSQGWYVGAGGSPGAPRNRLPTTRLTSGCAPCSRLALSGDATSWSFRRDRRSAHAT